MTNFEDAMNAITKQIWESDMRKESPMLAIRGAAIEGVRWLAGELMLRLNNQGYIKTADFEEFVGDCAPIGEGE